MRKDICFNINQLILTTLHRLQLSIQTKTIKIPIMIKHIVEIWKDCFPSKYIKLLKQEFVHFGNIE